MEPLDESTLRVLLADAMNEVGAELTGPPNAAWTHSVLGVHALSPTRLLTHFNKGALDLQGTPTVRGWANLAVSKNVISDVWTARVDVYRD